MSEHSVAEGATIPAIAVYPGTAGSVHLTEVSRPWPTSDQVLVNVRRVGVCGTDQEIIAAQFGSPPAGSKELVLGHEVLGIVEQIGANVTELAVGDLVTATVRRPDGCPACRAGQPDMCVWRTYTERGIIGAHGFMTEQFVEEPRYLVNVPPELELVGVLLEPLSVVEKAVRQADLIQRRIASWAPATALVMGAGPIGLLGTLLLRSRGIDVVTIARRPAPNAAAAIIEASGGRYISTRETPLAELARSLPSIDLILEATGVSALSFTGMEILGSNGVLVLLSLTGGTEIASIPIDLINRDFVLGNKVMVGSVNSAHEDFVQGVADLARFASLWPGLTERLITTRLHGLRDAHTIAGKIDDGIKTVIEVGG